MYFEVKYILDFNLLSTTASPTEFFSCFCHGGCVSARATKMILFIQKKKKTPNSVIGGQVFFPHIMMNHGLKVMKYCVRFGDANFMTKLCFFVFLMMALNT